MSLEEALELTALIAFKDPRRHGRASARWMRRYLDTNDAAGLDDIVFVAGCLSALGGRDQQAAIGALKAMADRATSQHRPTRIAS